MCKELLEKLNELTKIPFWLENDHVLATPLLLKSTESQTFLKKYLTEAFLNNETEASNAVDLIKSILFIAKTKLLNKQGVPIGKVQQTLNSDGFKVSVVKINHLKRPVLVGIQTNKGTIIVSLETASLTFIEEVLAWGYE